MSAPSAEKMALDHALDAIVRWRDAETAWDTIRWEESGPTKHAAAAELADAKAALRRVVEGR